MLIFVVHQSSSRQLFLGLQLLLDGDRQFCLSLCLKDSHILSSTDFVEVAPWQMHVRSIVLWLCHQDVL
jgi:hypothetical protein